MSKKLTLLTLATFSFSLHAEMNPGLLSILNKPVEPKVSCSLDDAHRFKACLESICGSPATNITYGDLYTALSEDASVNEDETQEFKNTIKDYIDHKIALGDSIQALLSDSSALAKTPIEESQKPLHKTFYLTNLLENIPWDKVVKDMTIQSPHASYVIDENELKKSLGTKAHFSSAILEMLNSPDFKVMIHGNQFGWTLTNQALYPNLKTQEVIKKELDKMKANLKDLEIKQPKVHEIMTTFQIVDPKIIDQIQSEQNPSEVLQANFFRSTKTFNLIYSMLTKGGPEFNKISPNTMGDFYPDYEISTRAIKNKYLYQGMKKSSEHADNLLNHCQAIFEKNQKAMPTLDELRKFSVKAELLRSEMKKNISSNLSVETAKALSGPLDNIYFSYPPTRDEVSELMRKEASVLKDDLKITEDLIQGKSQKLTQKDIKLSLLHGFMFLTEDKFFEDMKDVCDDYEVPVIDDASFNLGSGKIRISWLSIKKPHSGMGVLAHEFGHALAHIMRGQTISLHSGEKFKQARECLGLKIPGGEVEAETLRCQQGAGVKQLDYEISQYAEENWADLFSAKFAPKNTPNTGCFILEKENGEYSNTNFYPIDHSDTHAPDIFRTLHVEFLKSKTLPASCLDVLEDHEKTSLMSDCLK